MNQPPSLLNMLLSRHTRRHEFITLLAGAAVAWPLAGHVVKEKRPSYKYTSEVRVGATLPTSGVTYYEVPKEYGVTKYRYTIVNERAVLVEPE